MKKLTKQQQEHFEYIPYYAIPEMLSELYSWEADGFEDWTISELIELCNGKIKSRRERELSKQP